MTVDMQALQSVLAGISTLVDRELTFEILGATTLTIHQMTMAEEIAVQRYAQEALQGETLGQAGRTAVGD